MSKQFKIESEIFKGINDFHYWYTKVKNILCEKLNIERSRIRIPSDIITLYEIKNDSEIAISNSYCYEMEEYIKNHNSNNYYKIKLECELK